MVPRPCYNAMMSPRRDASESLVRLHSCPSGSLVADSRLSMALAPFRFAMGLVLSVCRHMTHASLRNLAPSLDAESSPLKVRSSAVWASKAGMWDRARRWFSDMMEKDSMWISASASQKMAACRISSGVGSLSGRYSSPLLSGVAPCRAACPA